ncbi:MAG: DNA gyrase inhibitor YacG [Myxococcaceae bacterium]
MPKQCPICNKPVLPRAENPGFPFCSMRCKQVDLGRWFGETYRVPAEARGEDGGVEASEASADDEHEAH